MPSREKPDALLKAFAGRLTAGIRATDTVARLGGDEFAVVMEAFGTRADGLRVAEKIVMAMRPPFLLGEHTVQVTSSIGIAFFMGEAGIDADQLLKVADDGLYQAKDAGRDRVGVGGAAREPAIAAEGVALSPSSSN